MGELGEIVKKSVQTGEELASKTALSMDEINEKVKAINSAITVIDQLYLKQYFKFKCSC